MTTTTPINSTTTTTHIGKHVAMTSAQMFGKTVLMRIYKMTKPYKAPQDAQSDQKNRNPGTSGTNPLWDKAQGNRGKQLDPKQGGGKRR